MNAKPIIICILATLLLSPLAFAEKSGRYVNSREGLNIRAKPNTRASDIKKERRRNAALVRNTK